MGTNFYASTESASLRDPRGLDTVTSREGGFPHPVRVSHWVRERGAGAPLATAGGSRGSLRVAGPYATYTEALEEAARRNARA